MDIDAVIIEAEFQIESIHNPYGHFVVLRFVDITPNKPKLMKTIEDITKHDNVELIDYSYKETPITEKTSLKYLDIVRH